MSSNLVHDLIVAVCPIVGIGGPFTQQEATAWPNTYPALDGSYWRIDFDPSATSAQQSAAISLLASTDTTKLTPPPTVTFLQFMALFTAAEQTALVNTTDTQTRLFIMMATGAGTITLNNPEVVAGVNYIATAAPNGPGLIAPSRVAQILAGQAPS